MRMLGLDHEYDYHWRCWMCNFSVCRLAGVLDGWGLEGQLRLYERSKRSLILTRQSSTGQTELQGRKVRCQPSFSRLRRPWTCCC